MAKDTLKTVKSWIVNSESDFVEAAKLINGIVIGLQSWHNRYGKKQYYNGLKSSRWVDQKINWSDRLYSADRTFNTIYEILCRSKKVCKQKNVSIETLNLILGRVEEKRELINHLIGELQVISLMVDNYYAEDPKNRFTGEKDENGKSIVNVKYKSMTKAMDQTHRDQIDNFYTCVLNLSAIQSIYHILRAQFIPLLDRKISEAQRKEENALTKTPQTFKEQLVDLKERMDKEKANNDSYNKWVTQQYKKLERFSTTCNHLLTPEESFGICELPIVLVNSYLNEAAVKKLVWAGYKVDRALGSYLVIENALLLGIQSDSNEDGLQKSTYVWEDIQNQWQEGKVDKSGTIANKIGQLSHIFSRGMTPIGPMIRKGGHLYAWLIPRIIIQHRDNGFVLKEWDIQLSG